MGQLADALVANLKGGDGCDTPYPHWLLREVFPADIAQAVDSLDLPDGTASDYGGRRELNNSSRVFFDPQIQAENSTVAAVAQAFKSPKTIGAVESLTGIDLSGALLRLEYCRDTDGFWLEPHTDISAKLYTMLWYLSVGEGSDNCGTDIFDENMTLVKSAPFVFNTALIFVPGGNTWHGFNRRKINGTRKTVIINYVKPDWRSRHELAFHDPVK